MFAPVVARCRTYGVALEGAEAGYAEAVWRRPAVTMWVSTSQKEGLPIAKYDGA